MWVGSLVKKDDCGKGRKRFGGWVGRRRCKDCRDDKSVDQRMGGGKSKSSGSDARECDSTANCELRTA